LGKRCGLFSEIYEVMQNNRSWYRLNLDIFAALDKKVYSEIVKSTFTNTPTKKEELVNKKISWRNFDKTFLCHLHSIGMMPENLFIFYKQPSTDNSPHVDMYEDGTDRKCVYAINQLITDDQSYMRWFRNTKEDDLGIVHNQFGRYQIFNENELIEIDRCRIGSIPTLVRTDIPHNITMGNVTRICLSLRLRDEIKNWDDAVKFFQPFIDHAE